MQFKSSVKNRLGNQHLADQDLTYGLLINQPPLQSVHHISFGEHTGHHHKLTQPEPLLAGSFGLGGRRRCLLVFGDRSQTSHGAQRSNGFCPGHHFIAHAHLHIKHGIEHFVGNNLMQDQHASQGQTGGIALFYGFSQHFIGDKTGLYQKLAQLAALGALGSSIFKQNIAEGSAHLIGDLQTAQGLGQLHRLITQHRLGF